MNSKNKAPRIAELAKENGFGVWRANLGEKSVQIWLKTDSEKPDFEQEHVHPDDISGLWDFFQSLSSSKNRGTFRTARLLQNGKWHWYLFRGKNRKNKSNYEGILGLFDAEKAREDEIFHSNTLKESIYRALGHDLKGQFSSLLGFSDILMESYLGMSEEDRFRYIGFMRTISTNTFLLVDNMLNWVKLQQRNLKPDIKLISVQDKFEEVFGYIQFAVEIKSIRLKVEISPGLKVQADSVLLTSVLLNLLTNAIKFSDNNSQVTIKARILKNEVEIQVIDSGQGIDMHVLPQIFSPNSLYTTKGTMNETGSGLGLKIAKEFTELMKGKLNFTSKQGVGTKVSVKLPLQII